MEDGSEIHRNKEVQQGDLLIARKNTPELVGACVLVKEAASNLMFPDLVFRMHPNDGIEGLYLVTLLSNSPFASEVRGLAHGTARSMSNIPKSVLAKLSIPVPPLTLQQEFGTFVTQVDKSGFDERIKLLCQHIDLTIGIVMSEMQGNAVFIELLVQICTLVRNAPHRSYAIPRPHVSTLQCLAGRSHDDSRCAQLNLV